MTIGFNHRHFSISKGKNEHSPVRLSVYSEMSTCNAHFVSHNILGGLLKTRPVHIPCRHSVYIWSGKKKQALAWMWQRVWGSLWAPTTCSVSHILSHLWGGTYLVRSTTQLLYNTFSRHQTLHSRGARELRRARLLPWPLSLSRFPRTEGKCSDQPSQNACCTILTNRHRSCAQNNHRHCCCDGDK